MLTRPVLQILPLISLALALSGCDLGLLATGNVTAQVHMDENGCLLKQVCPGEGSCEENEKTCVAHIKVKQGYRIVWQADQQEAFKVILTPSSSRNIGIFPRRRVTVDRNAAAVEYKYTVVGNPRAERCPFKDNVCDPRIKVDPY